MPVMEQSIRTTCPARVVVPRTACGGTSTFVDCFTMTGAPWRSCTTIWLSNEHPAARPVRPRAASATKISRCRPPRIRRLEYRRVTSEPFVPPDFVVPLRLETPQFVLDPLGPQHNDADYAAWSSSMEHIHATPGWEESSWPRSMTLEENRADLERHAADFESRTGFTYTVLSPGGDVIGCVYIYPSKKDNVDAQ